MKNGALSTSDSIVELELPANCPEANSLALDAALLESETAVQAGPKVNGIAIGSLVGFSGRMPVIQFDLSGEPVQAVAVAVTCELESKTDCGTLVCVAFQNGNPERPIVIGRIVGGIPGGQAGKKSRPALRLDSENEIVLRCGQASIQLKSDGTVAIRGKNVATRATHTNRIRGGNVQIN